MNNPRFYTLLGFILLGIASRFIPHPPNFTALASIALFSFSSLGSLPLAAIAVFACTFGTDIFLGLYPSIHYVYLSYGLIILMGYRLKTNTSFSKTIPLQIASSILFFAVTNFGDWLVLDLYPKTASGLGLCYFAGLPFLLNQFLGTIFYSAIIYNAKKLKFVENIGHAGTYPNS